ncbi:hypothetical protein QJU93_09945 [Pasteurella skyensis]|uniref:Phage virion morphogenesis family protein n=1 Tax=Phocoenobacter skyensis TaxID=97481 RepID=A0AAJ6NBL7_9PAST|nr:hypothetical protein [Pasteurella skyensis]MDP8173676.1 hypothetical protein [Pasteurella skyensis]MDP8178044.1 hypothetical protein [Pasteurella skyensis]
MSDVFFGLKKEDLKNFRSDLERMTLSGDQKRRIIKWTLGRIKQNSVKNIRSQTDIHGRKYRKRIKQDDNRRMLKKVLRFASIYADTSGQGKIYYKNKLTGEIASYHQEGLQQVMTAEQMKKRSHKSKGNSPDDTCTRQQAKALRDLGYKKRVGKYKNGKTKYKKYTLKELQETLTIKWASMIIRRRRKQLKTGKKSWIINTPKRSFLEVNNAKNADILEELIQKFVTGEYQ